MSCRRCSKDTLMVVSLYWLSSATFLKKKKDVSLILHNIAVFWMFVLCMSVAYNNCVRSRKKNFNFFTKQGYEGIQFNACSDIKEKPPFLVIYKPCDEGN